MIQLLAIDLIILTHGITKELEVTEHMHFPPFLKNNFIFINLCLVALGLRCCPWAFTVAESQDCSLAAVHRLLTVVASLVKHRLWVLWLQQLQLAGLSDCGSWAQLLCSMWNPPRPGIKPMSHALAVGLPSTVPPGKSISLYF